MENYLAAHHDIDLILDTVPWNGHTTTLHGLWMGVPTLSVRGHAHISRFGEMVMEAAGLENFLVDVPGAFGDRAAALVGDVGQLSATRKRARAALLSSELCDHKSMAKRFEDACFTMLDELEAER